MILLVCSHAQAVHLFLCQIAPLATTQVLLGQTGKLNAVELGHLVAKALEDAAHNAVLTRMDLNAHLLLVHRIGILNGIGLDLTVFKHHAFGNLLQVVGRHIAVGIYMINLLLQELRMGQLRSQIAIVGQEQHTSGVTVQTTYGIDALRAGILHQVHHGLALLGIVARGDIVLRLVEKNVDLLLQRNRILVEAYHIGAHDFGAQFGDYLTIDGHHTCLNELVGLATAAYTGISQELVQTDGLVGIEVLLLIFYTLLQAVLCIGIIVGRMLTVTALTLLIAATRLEATLLTGLIAATRLVALALLALLIAATRLIAFALLARLIAALTLLIATTLLEATLLTGLIAAALLIASLALLALLITALTLLIAATRLIATLLLTILLTGLIAATRLVALALLARLIAVVGTWAIAATLLGLTLKTGPKAFGTELAIVLALILVKTGTFVLHRVNTGTRRTAHGSEFFLITVTASLCF